MKTKKLSYKTIISPIFTEKQVDELCKEVDKGVLSAAPMLILHNQRVLAELIGELYAKVSDSPNH